MNLNNTNNIFIDGKEIGLSKDPFIVAELSGNHNGEIERAKEIILSAKNCGADAVKIQTYTPDTITINHDSEDFLIKEGLWKGKYLYDLYKEAHTPWEWHKDLFKYAKKIGITLFSSPFDKTAVDFLEELGNPVYKIASPELIDLELIKKVASTNKPIIFSTGMASISEISDAITTARKNGAQDLIVLHCTSAYPAPIEEANLSTIDEISKRFSVLAGLSDHTKGILVPALASVMGACLIEKHFTISRSEGGVDSDFSIEPHELESLVKQTKDAKSAIGKPAFDPTDSEGKLIKGRRSLYIVKNLKKGQIITEEYIKSIRPGYGVLPKYINLIIGSKAVRNLNFGEPFSLDMIENHNKIIDKINEDILE